MMLPNDTYTLWWLVATDKHYLRTKELLLDQALDLWGYL